MIDSYVGEVIDLTDRSSDRIYNMSADDARRLVRSNDPEAVRGIEGTFALIAVDGKTVRMARSLDRPVRYFLAKKHAGPALVVADRIDQIRDWLDANNLGAQFHPSYTRMVPAHYIVEVQLIGCPDPDPVYTRFFAPRRDALPADPEHIGRLYVGAVAEEVSKWLRTIEVDEPIGVCFSGGIDSGAVFLITYYVMRQLGMSPARLKAFTLDAGGGPDVEQARRFLDALDLGMFLETIEVDASTLDADEAIRVVEDYKPLDIDCAMMGLALCRGIREKYPRWRYLVDGDGGDENLKDYPIEENPELTIRSVVNNTMLYQEGWGVGKIKHSLTYSGGLSRSYARTRGPARHNEFTGFSPYTRPDVIEIAEGIPFAAMTEGSVERLYALKGSIVGGGVKSLFGVEMPIFPKRRFQHGAISPEALGERVPAREIDYRQRFLAMYL